MSPTTDSDAASERCGKREVLDSIAVAIGHDDSAFGGMPQRANVAGPVVPDQGLAAHRGQLPLRLIILARIELEIVIEEERDVFPPLAQRRKLDLDRVEAEQQVLPEALCVRQLIDRNVGGSDNPNVDGDRLVRTDRDDLPLLERSEQLGLQMQRQVADFVEEQRAVVGGLEPSDAVACPRP